MNGTGPLATFAKPPIIEAVLGVQFDPIPTLGPTRLGAYWASVRDRWPHFDEQPPLEATMEFFGEQGLPWRPEGLQLRIQKLQELRVRLKSASSDRMIQAQSNRFHFNWMATEGGPSYPRYETIRGEFEEAFEDFEAYLAKEGLPKPVPNQWEVIYINHIFQGTTWKHVTDWHRSLAPFTDWAASNLRLETMGANWSYEIPERQGRLHVQLRHGRKKDSDPPMMLLTLTARGPTADLGVIGGLDLGRAAIVRAFAEITSPEAHRFWGRQQ